MRLVYPFVNVLVKFNEICLSRQYNFTDIAV